MKVPSNVINFATEKNLTPYIMFRDYYNQAQSMSGGIKKEFSTTDDQGKLISFDEKESLMSAALKKEILRVSGISNFNDFPLETWVSNPTLAWATFAVVSAMIDMILPEAMVDWIGLFTDVRNIGWGDSALFEVETRDVFSVSKAGRAQRSTEIHRQFKGNVSIVPEMRELTVAVSLLKVLAGSESLAEFVRKVVYSMERQVSLDAYDSFAALMASLPTTATTGLQVAGYSQASLVRLAQQVSAWNANRAVIVGTQLALVNVLPDDANYRYTLNDDFAKLGYIKTAFGFDVICVPQIADLNTEWAMRIADDRLWILSPSSQKLLKLVLEGSTMSNTDTVFQNANLLQKSTLYKSYGVGTCTNSVAGVLTI